MYLSDLLVVSNKIGGRERVFDIVEVLLEMPDDWWEFRGCRNWIKVAYRQIQENPEKFMEDLERYAESKWHQKEPFMDPEEE